MFSKKNASQRRIYCENSIGPKTEPCRTPAEIQNNKFPTLAQAIYCPCLCLSACQMTHQYLFEADQKSYSMASLIFPFVSNFTSQNYRVPRHQTFQASSQHHKWANSKSHQVDSLVHLAKLAKQWHPVWLQRTRAQPLSQSLSFTFMNILQNSLDSMPNWFIYLLNVILEHTVQSFSVTVAHEMTLSSVDQRVILYTSSQSHTLVLYLSVSFTHTRFCH